MISFPPDLPLPVPPVSRPLPCSSSPDSNLQPSNSTEGREVEDGRGMQLPKMRCCGGCAAAGFNGEEGAVVTPVTFFSDHHHGTSTDLWGASTPIYPSMSVTAPLCVAHRPLSCKDRCPAEEGSCTSTFRLRNHLGIPEVMPQPLFPLASSPSAPEFSWNAPAFLPAAPSPSTPELGVVSSRYTHGPEL